MEKIKIFNANIELTELEIYQVVQHWHDTMITDIFQNEYGHDLSEFCENTTDVLMSFQNNK